MQSGFCLAFATRRCGRGFDPCPNSGGSQQAVGLQEMADFHKSAVNDGVVDDRLKQGRLNSLVLPKFSGRVAFAGRPDLSS